MTCSSSVVLFLSDGCVSAVMYRIGHPSFKGCTVHLKISAVMYRMGQPSSKGCISYLNIRQCVIILWL